MLTPKRRLCSIASDHSTPVDRPGERNLHRIPGDMSRPREPTQDQLDIAWEALQNRSYRFAVPISTQKNSFYGA